MALGGAIAGSARVIIGADTRDLTRGMSDAERSFIGSVGRMRRLALGLGGTLGIGLAFRAAWDEMAQGQQVAAQTEAVLKSTGAVAGVTAGHVNTLATALLKKSGVDDEVIKSGENVLLTFTNVRNVVGQGNDVFTQATKVALDMSVALGKDLQGSVIAIGKALQDPIRGFTALRRVGVNFNEAQKEQIKTLIAAGDVMGAQKLILHELQTEFAGSAEAAGKTLPGQINILKESLRNLGGEILTDAAPAITEVTKNLLGWLDELQNNKQMQGELKDAVHDAVDEVKAMARTAQDVADKLGGWKTTLELIFALGVANKIRTITAAFTALAGTEAAAGAVAGAGAFGRTTGIGGAASRSTLLLKNLTLLSKLTIPAIVVTFLPKWGYADKTGASLEGVAGELQKLFGGDFGNIDWSLLLTGDTGVLGSQFAGDKPKTSSAASGAGSGSGAGAVATGKRKAIVATAERLGPKSGTVYVWGGTQVGKGYDCSGYVYDVYKRNGVTIPRTSQAQWGDPNAVGVTLDELLPGDAVFFNNGDGGPQPGHVGLVVSGRGADATMIDYFHSGAKAEYKKVSEKGLPFMGGRRWIKIERASTGGGAHDANLATADQTANQAKAPKSGAAAAAKGTPPLIPARFRLAIAKAELTKGNADDLAALNALEQYLNTRIAKEKDAEKKIQLLDELRQTRDKIAAIKKGDTTPASTDILPARLRIGLAEAELTKNTKDDLAALRAIEDYLVARLAKEKDANKRLAELGELKSVRDQIATLTKKDEPVWTVIPKSMEIALTEAEVSGSTARELAVLDKIVRYLIVRVAKEKDINKRLEDLRALKQYRDQIASTVKPSKDATGFDASVGKLIGAEPQTGGPGNVRDFTTGTVTAEASGSPGDVRDFRNTNITASVSAAEQVKITKLVTTQQPAILALKAYWQQLFNKRKVARSRLAAARRTLRMLRSRPARMQSPSAIGTVSATIALLEDDIAKLTQAIDAITARILDLQGTMDDDISKAANEEEAAQGVGPGGFILDDTNIHLVDPTKGDSGGPASGEWHDPAADAAGEQARMRAELEAAAAASVRANTIGFLTGVRGLQGFQGNIWDPLRSLQGSTIVIQNNAYAAPPPDPHAFSTSLAHELKAITA